MEDEQDLGGGGAGGGRAKETQTLVDLPVSQLEPAAGVGKAE